MILPNKLYDVLKWLACIAFNAIGVLYKTLAGAWGLPYPEQVMITCSAIALFIGTVIGVSTAEYNAQKAKNAAKRDQFAWHDKELDE